MNKKYSLLLGYSFDDLWADMSKAAADLLDFGINPGGKSAQWVGEAINKMGGNINLSQLGAWVNPNPVTWSTKKIMMFKTRLLMI